MAHVRCHGCPSRSHSYCEATFTPSRLELQLQFARHASATEQQEWVLTSQHGHSRATARAAPLALLACRAREHPRAADPSSPGTRGGARTRGRAQRAVLLGSSDAAAALAAVENADGGDDGGDDGALHPRAPPHARRCAALTHVELLGCEAATGASAANVVTVYSRAAAAPRRPRTRTRRRRARARTRAPRRGARRARGRARRTRRRSSGGRAAGTRTARRA